jgi:hypothetical protein
LKLARAKTVLCLGGGLRGTGGTTRGHEYCDA